MYQVEPHKEYQEISPQGEGPYKVTRRVVGASYYLQDAAGKDILRP